MHSGLHSSVCNSVLPCMIQVVGVFVFETASSLTLYILALIGNSSS